MNPVVLVRYLGAMLRFTPQKPAETPEEKAKERKVHSGGASRIAERGLACMPTCVRA